MQTFEPRSYTEIIRLRFALLIGGIVLVLVYIVLVGETGGDSRVMDRFAIQTADYIGFTALGVMIWRAAHNYKLLKSRPLLKAQQLRERDERARFLHIRSGGLPMDLTLLALLFLTMTAGFYNNAAFYTVFAGLAAASLAKAGSYLYFSRNG